MASLGRGDLWQTWLLLHAPMWFMRGCISNLLRWRLYYLDAAVHAHPRPSGFVPGAGLGRRGRRSSSAGGEEDDGLDGVSPNLCRVLCVRFEDLVIFALFSEVLSVKLMCTGEN